VTAHPSPPKERTVSIAIADPPDADRRTPAPPRLPGLSIVLPCYDEAPNVAAAVAEAHAAARRFAQQHEVIVVDDGSRDGTRAIAEVLAARDPRVRVVTHPENRGYGAAVRSGLRASRGAWVLLTDGDLQFDLGELAAMLPLAADHELVAGYRIDRADPATRRLAAHAWNALVRRSFGVGVRDVDCAFKLMRGDAVRALPLESEGAMVSTELLVRAHLAGWRIAEVGVHHRPRVAGEATGGDARVVLRAFRERRALARRLRAEAAAPGRPLPRPTVT
jgi:glycosyltransferase involved in cell wall biosynthesis